MFQAKTCFNAIFRALETQVAVRNPSRISNLSQDPTVAQATVGVVKGIYGIYFRQLKRNGWEILIDDGIEELSIFIPLQMGMTVNLGSVVGVMVKYQNNCYQGLQLHIIGQVLDSDVIPDSVI